MKKPANTNEKNGDKHAHWDHPQRAASNSNFVYNIYVSRLLGDMDETSQIWFEYFGSIPESKVLPEVVPNLEILPNDTYRHQVGLLFLICCIKDECVEWNIGVFFYTYLWMIHVSYLSTCLDPEVEKGEPLDYV
jgi:hypothetical protein